MLAGIEGDRWFVIASSSKPHGDTVGLGAPGVRVHERTHQRSRAPDVVASKPDPHSVIAPVVDLGLSLRRWIAHHGDQLLRARAAAGLVPYRELREARELAGALDVPWETTSADARAALGGLVRARAAGQDGIRIAPDGPDEWFRD